MRKVIASYEVVYKNAIKLTAGTKVSVLKRETKAEWLGWVWCSSDDGQAGWISETYLSISGQVGILKMDYDAREVSVQKDEIVEVLKQANGWCWIKKTDGGEGWIPSENLAAQRQS